MGAGLGTSAIVFVALGSVVIVCLGSCAGIYLHLRAKRARFEQGSAYGV